jgi:hypothetical protein
MIDSKCSINETFYSDMSTQTAPGARLALTLTANNELAACDPAALSGSTAA